MTELIYPFDDARVIVTNIGQDRAGQFAGMVAVQTPDGAGYLAAPRSFRLFDIPAWDRLTAEAASRNGLGRSEWTTRGELVRNALASDLSPRAPEYIEPATDEAEVF